KRRRMRLEVRRGVATGYAVGVELQLGNEALGEAHGLVGDDAPGDAAPAQLGDELRDAREKPSFLADALGVVLEEHLTQRFVFRVARLDAEGRVHEAARARRGERAQPLDGQGRLAPVPA